jgi:hypothetical protein
MKTFEEYLSEKKYDFNQKLNAIKTLKKTSQPKNYSQFCTFLTKDVNGSSCKINDLDLTDDDTYYEDDNGVIYAVDKTNSIIATVTEPKKSYHQDYERYVHAM